MSKRNHYFQLMRSMLNLVPIPMSLIELFGGRRALYVNPATMRYLLPERESRNIIRNAEVFNTFLYEWQDGVTKPDGSPIAYEQRPLVRLIHGETFSNYEIRFRHFYTKEIFHLMVSGDILPPFYEAPSYGLLAFVDITPCVAQREQYRDALKVRDEFISVTSHELKTPVTSILLQAQNLMKMLGSDEKLFKEASLSRLANMERVTLKLRDLIDECSEVSRGGGIRLHFQVLDLNAVVGECATRASQLSERDRSPLHLHLHGSEIRGSWDREKLERIIDNLLVNAVKYGSGRTIEVYTYIVNSNAVVRVRDHGIGVRDEDKERIFQRYERACPPESYGGMGLGLWIAAEDARTMQGRLWVEDPISGPGAVFVLQLPLGR